MSIVYIAGKLDIVNNNAPSLKTQESDLFVTKTHINGNHDIQLMISKQDNTVTLTMGSIYEYVHDKTESFLTLDYVIDEACRPTDDIWQKVFMNIDGRWFPHSFIQICRNGSIKLCIDPSNSINFPKNGVCNVNSCTLSYVVIG